MTNNYYKYQMVNVFYFGLVKCHAIEQISAKGKYRTDIVRPCHTSSDLNWLRKMKGEVIRYKCRRNSKGLDNNLKMKVWTTWDNERLYSMNWLRRGLMGKESGMPSIYLRFNFNYSTTSWREILESRNSQLLKTNQSVKC